ncbi:hypothetical protein [Bacillus sp. MMSF_3328]|uniref:hypothetical protein n=1 Tax=Bacillus sp. MMSF_3328 TaxID=3047080 RepID=UPI00273D00F4|nr:hypothetical protein [Bacillus sp. MMSF_3328]
MSNDSIVMELFRRVQKLEEKVQFLEGKIESQESQEIEQEECENQEQPQQVLITRANSRDYVADRLQQENPQFSIRKANREEGSGLVLNDDKGNKLILKYYYSKSFLEYPSGWHTVDISDLDSNAFDIYCFNVSFKDEYFVFFFTKDELKSYVKGKKLNSGTKYYFYFHIENGKIIEVRDDENDVSKYYDRWELPNELV